MGFIAEFREKSRGYVGEEGVNFAVRVLSELTIIGPAIIHAIHEVTTKRQWERAAAMFERTDEDLRAVEEEKIDKGFFETDEFQTLLFLALQQLQTTYDAEKLKALADGLAKGALREFSAESRKELFFRILRDMAPDELQMLKGLVPRPDLRNAPVDFWPVINEPHGEKLGVLQRLESKALVTMSLSSEMKLSGPRYGGQWSVSEAERAVKEALETPPSRHFRMSKLGLGFLTFFGEFSHEGK